MIPEIKNILYTTDLSENAQFAFSYAVTLANKFDAGITVMHIMEDLSPSGDSLVKSVIGEEKWQELRTQNERNILDSIQSRLADFCENISKELPACPFVVERTLVKSGNPVEEILSEAQSSDYDLIIMGAHGHGALVGAFMGSVSRRVLRRCKKPVLVIRLPEE